MIKVITFLMLFILSGCLGKVFKSDNPLAPIPAGLGKPAENGSEEYKMGWADGCETGLSTMVTGYYKSFYFFKQNSNMVENPEYYKAWKDSYTYCRQYSFRYSWDSFDAKKKQFGPLCLICPNELR